jgi:hypothetical protein
LVQHYRASVPSGNPPLSAIREHVVRALAVARGTGTDPIAALNDRFVDEFGRFRIWFDADLEKLAKELGVAPLQRLLNLDGGPSVAWASNEGPWLEPKTPIAMVLVATRKPSAVGR